MVKPHRLLSDRFAFDPWKMLGWCTETSPLLRITSTDFDSSTRVSSMLEPRTFAISLRGIKLPRSERCVPGIKHVAEILEWLGRSIQHEVNHQINAQKAASRFPTRITRAFCRSAGASLFYTTQANLE